MDYLIKEKYQVLFLEHVDQALNYVTTLKEEDFKAKVRSFTEEEHTLYNPTSHFLVDLLHL